MPLLTDTLHALRRAARTPRLVLLLWGAHLAIAAVAVYPALRFLEKWLANAPAGDEFLRRFSLPLFAALMGTGGKWGDGLGQLLSVVLVLTLLWATFIYDPLAHWVWGVGGWLRNLGALDFAGGTVVHISSGFSALVCAMFIGKRVGYGRESMAPHSMTMTMIGASLLWVGWFGFNAGSGV